MAIIMIITMMIILIIVGTSGCCLFSVIESLFNTDCKNPKESAGYLKLSDAACYPAKITGERSKIERYEQMILVTTIMMK